MIQWTTERRRVSQLKDYGKNPRRFTERGMADLKASMERLGYIDPVAVNLDGTIIGGHARKKTLKALGITEVDVRVPDRLLTEKEVEEAVVRLNKNIAGAFDFDILANQFEAADLMDWGFTPEDLGLAECADKNTGTPGALAEKFLIPPFSVLNSREGWWQKRKNDWLAKGITSELGRPENLMRLSESVKSLKPGFATSTSVFDPVLCELCYLWFTPPGGVVLDPFAGGSVRGVTASLLGRKYVGCDLRAEQVEANRVQAAALADPPVWHCADSRLIDKTCGGVVADFVFSCPPYADLEVYSNDPNDLSTLGYAEFVAAYREIIAKSCSLLAENRFACFVVGEVRDKKGFYRDFIGDTVRAFRDAGLEYYNEAILVTPAGSAAIRVGKQFSSSRKIGKTHQNVLVFVKGDAGRAAAACGPVEIPEDLFPVAED